MAGVLTNVGEDRMLGLMLNKGSGYALGNVTLRLFKNNFTPSEGDGTSTGYTEATFTGYAGVILTGTSWGITPGDPTVAAYAQQTFTCSSATSESIYGYYLATSSGGVVVAEAFSDGPYVVTNNGDLIRVTPQISAS